ncbi:hypothetical protein BKA65DRAFT_513979 [Rhexocercosporidium sp. MPI-PUGE-AT-0058]|nr:hypothetical protein BKA65DRAFT_513979 [Rhexocercosporidium sp. MPI-PUGE-AT-0058]
MTTVLAQQGTPLRVFAKFPDLPTEIRSLIWANASPSRPRVIQIAYEAEKETWRACVDSCGGLPQIIPVCREARQAALKPYMRLLETWIDLEEDTIFISDPMFNIRKPRSNFMDSAYLSSIKRIAFTEDVYFGMKLLYESYPLLVDPQAAIVRKMQGLSHFTLVLMEDGVGFDSDSEGAEFEYFDQGSQASGLDPGEDHDQALEEQDEQELAVVDLENGPTGSEPLQEDDSIPAADDYDENIDDEQWLSMHEGQAMERLCKGYFRHVGDIHFKSTMHSPDYWDSWYSYLEQINSDFDEQQVEDPEWKRPMVAIVEIKYGLHSIGQTPAIDWRIAPSPEENHSSEEPSDNNS